MMFEAITHGAGEHAAAGGRPDERETVELM